MKSIVLNVVGMTCAVCVGAVEKAVAGVDGVNSVNVNLANGKLKAEYDENKTNIDEIKNAVVNAGYGIGENNADGADNNMKSMLKRLIISTVFALPLFYISMGYMLGLYIPEFINPVSHAVRYTTFQLILSFACIINGRHFFIKGFKTLIKGTPTMDTLVASGCGAAFVFGCYMLIDMFVSKTYHNVHNLYFESIGMIITLVMLGKYLEARSKNKTACALNKLIDYMPKTATVIIEGEKITIEIEHISKGDIVAVGVGEQIPVDGKIVNGNSTVDESMLTGESIPREKSIGDSVYAGTINRLGYLEVEVETASDSTVLAGIINMVEQATMSKPHIAHIADRVCAVFVPAVISVAIISSFIWIICGADFEFALNIFISVLVIACPCALGLATPTAVTTAVGKGAENGILIRDAVSLELLSKVDTFVFDKTGTITVGKPYVTDVVTADGISKNKLIEEIVAAEIASGHPLSSAIMAYCDDNNLEKINFDDFEAIPGMGIKFTSGDDVYFVGNKKLMTEKGIATDDKNIDILSSQGKAIIIVSKNNNHCGIVAVSDTIRSSSESAVSILNKTGIKTMLLSGDNKLSTAFAAKKIGVKEYISDVLPNEKADCISKLKHSGCTVAMTGDGINDSVALTTADVGIAMGGGSEIAVEAADIVIMNDDIMSIVKTYNLSKIAMKNIKQNLFFAFVYNALLIPVAAGILIPLFNISLNPMIASAAMAMSSVSVVTNALRIKSKKLL